MREPIQTERLTLRPFTEEDAEALFAVFREPEVGRWVGGAHRTVDESRSLIARNLEHEREQGFAMWAVDLGGELIGEAGVQRLEKGGSDAPVEIGWVIARPHWGNGYASEAARRWLEIGFEQHGFDEILATVLPENFVSHRVARKIGMRRAGRRFVHGAEHDLYVAVNPGRSAAA
ncbi:MAG: GNAT family N-acetyltransferase [Actinomycetota bacterium]|nr:GNAT family N-acetyltransferase [Actinomycetota bacterium]MDQ5808009.1 GNAT family N-acetyltransferase [Actinomycetota bacterium]